MTNQWGTRRRNTLHALFTAEDEGAKAAHDPTATNPYDQAVDPDLWELWARARAHSRVELMDAAGMFDHIPTTAPPPR